MGLDVRLWHISIYVPEGLLIIAQQFTAGLSVSIPTDLSPEGTIENGHLAEMKLITPVVPSGLKTRMRPRLPSDKSLGYYQISLREKESRKFLYLNPWHSVISVVPSIGCG